jgi:hypothetical protein
MKYTDFLRHPGKIGALIKGMDQFFRDTLECWSTIKKIGPKQRYNHGSIRSCLQHCAPNQKSRKPKRQPTLNGGSSLQHFLIPLMDPVQIVLIQRELLTLQLACKNLPAEPFQRLQKPQHCILNRQFSAQKL